MELVNQSGMPTEITTVLDVAGRQHLLIVAKATYRIDTDGVVAVKEADQARPIAHADMHVGEPGQSAPRYEADMVLRKQRCDVIVDATAHAPDGKPVTELDVALRVGTLNKRVKVVGDRVWKRRMLGVTATEPQPFTHMPIHYGRAFGGSPPTDGSADGSEQEAYLQNPIGVGYCPNSSSDAVENMPLPNTESHDAPVTSPRTAMTPLAFGPIGRGWEPRRRRAGTYDEQWRRRTFPLLPADFDEAFFQCAPADQQIPFPSGGEQVLLQNLTPGRPIVAFDLPKPSLLLKILHANHTVSELTPVVDTLFFEPDEGLFSMVYRASLPLDRRGVFGVKILAVGPVCKRWWSARVFGTDDCGCGGDDSQDPAADHDHADVTAAEGTGSP